MRLKIGQEGTVVDGTVLTADEDGVMTFIRAFLRADDDAVLRVGTASPSDGGPSLVSLTLGAVSLLLSVTEARAFENAIASTNKKFPDTRVRDRTERLRNTVAILRRYCAEKNAEEGYPC